MRTTLTDDVHSRRAGGEGTPEAVWAASSFATELRHITLEHLVPLGRRVVVVAPHPDDEVLGTGGLLAILADRSCSVSVVSVTDGEASHPPLRGASSSAFAAALGVRRRAEAREGLARLGQSGARIDALRLPDGEVAAAEYRLDGMLAERIAPGDVVFATSPHDGHPDHEATGRSAERACARAGATLWFVPIWTWHWSHPRDVRCPWTRAVVLDLDTAAVARKRSAIAAHQSQLGSTSSGSTPILPSSVLAHFERPFEVFFDGSTRCDRPLRSR